MTAQEAKEVFDDLREEGETDETLLGKLYVMFQNDDLTIEQLESLVDILGYEFTPEFKAMSPEDQKTKGLTDRDPSDDDVSKKEIEDAKEITQAEKQGENKPEAGKGEEGKGDSGKEEPEESKEDEEKRAAKLFGFDKD